MSRQPTLELYSQSWSNVSAVLKYSSLAATALFAATSAYAVGTGTFAAGTGSITNPNPTTTVVTTTSTRTVIDWTHFNSNSGETVRFDQPTVDSVSLNRISGGPTIFNGALQSNGRVWLYNPDGMLFGAGSTVNVNSLLLTTAGISNATGSGFFTNTSRNFKFDLPGTSTAKITIDKGTINVLGIPSDAGYLVIQAPQITVTNGSKLFTPGGDIQLLAGETFTADFNGDGLLNYMVIDTPVLVENPGSTSTIDVREGSSLQFGKITIGALIKEDAVMDHVINLGGQHGPGSYNLATNPEKVVIKSAPNVYETIVPNPTAAAAPLVVASNADAFTNTSFLTRSSASLGDETVRDTTVNPTIANVAYERPYRVSIQKSMSEGSLNLLSPSAGTPSGNTPPVNAGSPDALANLSPAAGGKNNNAAPSDLADLSPSAGGEGSKGVKCANSFLDNAWMNDPTMSNCAN